MKRVRFSEQIRDAARKSGRTVYSIAKEMNVSPSTIHRFLRAESGLSLALVDRLAEVLDLHVRFGEKDKGK